MKKIIGSGYQCRHYKSTCDKNLSCRNEKASGLSEVNLEMIAASGQVGDEVMKELCQKAIESKKYARCMIGKQV